MNTKKINWLTSISTTLSIIYFVIISVFVFNYHLVNQLNEISNGMNKLILKWNQLHRNTQALLIVESDLIEEKRQWDASLTDFETLLFDLFQSEALKNLHKKTDVNLEKIQTWWQLPKQLLKQIQSDLDSYLEFSKTPDEGKLAYKLGRIDAKANPREFFLLSQVEFKAYQFFLVEEGFVKSLMDAAQRVDAEIALQKRWSFILTIGISVVLFCTAVYFNFRAQSKIQKLNETLEKRVEERTKDLQSVYGELQAIFDAFPDLYFWLEQDGTIAGYKTSQTSLLYTTPDKFLGKIVSNVVPEDVATLINEAMNEIASGNPLVSIEYSLPLSQGIKYFEARLVPLADKKILMIIRDISDRKAAMSELESAKKMAEEASRLKSDFLANMSHELRTPLNSILGFSQIIARTQPMTEQNKSNLQIINRSGGHLLALINDILDMAKIESGRISLNPSQFDLFKVIDDVRNICKTESDAKGLVLSVEKRDCVPQFVETDKTRLRQVLVNLLNNAVKFTEQGGVTMRVTCLDVPNDNKTTQKDPGTAHVTFQIEDTGVGIANNKLDQIFDPFIQDTAGIKSTEGAGLGLPISRKIARMMDGDITVDSQLGKGSLFTLTVLLKICGDVTAHQKRSKQKTVRLKADSLGGGQKLRILIVDDHKSNRMVLSQMLTYLDFNISEAENGEEAVQIWKEDYEKGHPPDLILMDNRMPVMDGLQATEIIKSLAAEKGIHTVIVAVSAMAFEKDSEGFLSSGCDDFVSKPFREEEIVEILEKHLGVRFVYEAMDGDQNDSDELSIRQMQLGIEELSEKLRIDFRKAVEQVDYDNAVVLLQDIKKENEALANALAEPINGYQFDKLEKLIKGE